MLNMGGKIIFPVDHPGIAATSRRRQELEMCQEVPKS
jgi:hypothetical protein